MPGKLIALKIEYYKKNGDTVTIDNNILKKGLVVAARNLKMFTE
jgi:hypothetical protein